MFDLKSFQADAAALISRRYAFFANHPDRPHKGVGKPRPFFQALSALTGAGKTPILAQAVALLRAHFSGEPIVFWMSKGKSVVAQTFTNFSAGGKYSEIVDGFRVINVPQLTPALIEDASTPLIVMATTGLFNNKDQAEGALNIYKKDEDLFGSESPWDRLIKRVGGGKRRPMVIVYDEGHNLSEQQVDILSELEPDAYLLASATMKLPESFNKSVIQHIRLWVQDASGERDAFDALGALDVGGKPDVHRFTTTAVQSEKVVDAQLVKRAVQFDGTTAPMEKCLDELTKRMAVLQGEIDARGLGFAPKAIYVCKTNISDSGEKDDPSRPFHQRKAPPIRIWNYLVNEKGVAPKDIAIYASLEFAPGAKPSDVNLFSKGESDFDEFAAGDYHHIIFNLALQEGWDDPACYLAYIDKSMGSSIQVEQVIGRVLRQYGATHYDTPLLNSAHFFIRVDSKSVFAESIDRVKTKLQAEGAPIEIVDNFAGSSTSSEDLSPKEAADVELHRINVDAEAASEHIAEIISRFPTFSAGSPDTLGQAHAASQVLELKNLAQQSPTPSWVAAGHTNPVRLRWLIATALRARSPGAFSATDLKDSKFDVLVQVGSNAELLAGRLVREIVACYFQHTELVYESHDKPFVFGTLRIPRSAPAFGNGLYERYTGFNKFERSFADKLDDVGCVWHRNPSVGGFHIPLLSEGDTASFFPDFIAWQRNLIYCIDTKGSHLLADAVARKLFDIQDGGKTKILARFISEGKQSKLREKPIKGGYTVWKMKNGNPTPVYVDSMEKAVKECLK